MHSTEAILVGMEHTPAGRCALASWGVYRRFESRRRYKLSPFCFTSLCVPSRWKTSSQKTFFPTVVVVDVKDPTITESSGWHWPLCLIRPLLWFLTCGCPLTVYEGSLQLAQQNRFGNLPEHLSWKEFIERDNGNDVRLQERLIMKV